MRVKDDRGLPKDILVAYAHTGRVIIKDKLLYELVNKHYADQLLRFVLL